MAVSVSSSSIVLLPLLLLCSLSSACDRCVHHSRASFLTSSLTLAAGSCGYVKSSKLDAKIDSVKGTLIMTTNRVNVHEQMIESMKNLNARTYMLAKSLLDLGHPPAQEAAR